MENEIRKYTVEQWAEYDGLTIEEIYECYGEDVVAFYTIEGSEVAGCQHANGRCDVFGAGMDTNDVAYEAMVDVIQWI